MTLSFRASCPVVGRQFLFVGFLTTVVVAILLFQSTTLTSAFQITTSTIPFSTTTARNHRLLLGQQQQYVGFDIGPKAAASTIRRHGGSSGTIVPTASRRSRRTSSSSTSCSMMTFAAADVLAVVNNFYQSSPYVAAALTCGTKACAADYVAQRTTTTTTTTTSTSTTSITKSTLSSSDNKTVVKTKFETMRNVAFVVYGAIYQGMAQEYIYNHLYPLWFGNDTTLGVVLIKVLFDLLVQTTLVTLPIAYLIKTVVIGGGSVQRSPLLEAMRHYWHDVTTNGLLTKYFALWGPVQCLTFSVVPQHLRVSFIAVVSFFWLIILSSVSARPRQLQRYRNQQLQMPTTATMTTTVVHSKTHVRDGNDDEECEQRQQINKQSSIVVTSGAVDK